MELRYYVCTRLRVTVIVKPMAHLNVSCESEVRKKLSQENLRKLLAKVLRDTLLQVEQRKLEVRFNSVNNVT